MAEFAIIAPDGTVENIVVAANRRRVHLRPGRTVKPMASNAEIGGRHDGTRFVRMVRAPEVPAVEPAALRAIRALANEISPQTKVRIEAIIGAAP